MFVMTEVTGTLWPQWFLHVTVPPAPGCSFQMQSLSTDACDTFIMFKCSKGPSFLQSCHSCSLNCTFHLSLLSRGSLDPPRFTVACLKCGAHRFSSFIRGHSEDFSSAPFQISSIYCFAIICSFFSLSENIGVLSSETTKRFVSPDTGLLLKGLEFKEDFSNFAAGSVSSSILEADCTLHFCLVVLFVTPAEWSRVSHS